MKRLILLAMHGAGGAGGKYSYSPNYPWTPTENEQEFISENVMVDPRISNQLFQGLYWKGCINAGMKLAEKKCYDSVTVLCTKGNTINKHGKWFAIETIKSLIHAGDDVDIVPVGKSIGGFDSLEVVDHFDWKINTKQWRRKIGSVHTPFALMIDPDDFFTSDPNPARKVPSSIEEVLVIRQENRSLKDNFMPHGLCGRKLARKNGSFKDITDVVYPIPTLFPDSDPFFPNREVTHWTIDEHMVFYGHPTMGTIESIIESKLC